ncbi:hypothetical protein ACJJTC_010337 [Scirpophaga incertulas]
MCAALAMVAMRTWAVHCRRGTVSSMCKDTGSVTVRLTSVVRHVRCVGHGGHAHVGGALPAWDCELYVQGHRVGYSRQWCGMCAALAMVAMRTWAVHCRRGTVSSMCKDTGSVTVRLTSVVRHVRCVGHGGHAHWCGMCAALAMVAMRTWAVHCRRGTVSSMCKDTGSVTVRLTSVVRHVRCVGHGGHAHVGGALPAWDCELYVQGHRVGYSRQWCGMCAALAMVAMRTWAVHCRRGTVSSMCKDTGSVTVRLTSVVRHVRCVGHGGHAHVGGALPAWDCELYVQGHREIIIK